MRTNIFKHSYVRRFIWCNGRNQSVNWNQIFKLMRKMEARRRNHKLGVRYYVILRPQGFYYTKGLRVGSQGPSRLSHETGLRTG